jgi:ketosteroid isomerase-like protein
MDEQRVVEWVEGYLRAWTSNDPDDIGSLFTDEAEYRTAPDAEPRRGRAAIVAGWLEDRDEPGDATFSFEVIGFSGSRGFVQGVTTYRADPERPSRTYDNLWVIDLDDEGRATSFTEWYMRRR